MARTGPSSMEPAPAAAPRQAEGRARAPLSTSATRRLPWRACSTTLLTTRVGRLHELVLIVEEGLGDLQ